MAIEFDNQSIPAKNSVSLDTLLTDLTNRKISTKDRLFFTEQLSLLLETGNSLHVSLESLAKQANHPEMRKLINALVVDIKEGCSFSRALSKYPKVFSASYVNLIAAGEEGGFMDTVLDQLREMEEKKEQLMSSVASALSYPAFLMVFSLSVTIFVLVAVFPKFSEMFKSIEDTLPVTTKILMQISQLLLNQWPIVIAGVVAVTISLVVWMGRPSGKIIIDDIKLRLPLIKNIFIALYFIQAFRILGLSLANGVNVTDALVSCKEVVSNRRFMKLIETVQNKVQSGAGISYGFNEADFVPVLVKQMITTGEETGNLAKVMTRIADHYEKVLAKKLDILSKMAEPFMLLLMGLVVGVIVSSLILPIFQLSRSAG